MIAISKYVKFGRLTSLSEGSFLEIFFDFEKKNDLPTPEILDSSQRKHGTI